MPRLPDFRKRIIDRSSAASHYFSPPITCIRAFFIRDEAFIAYSQGNVIHVQSVSDFVQDASQGNLWMKTVWDDYERQTISYKVECEAAVQIFDIFEFRSEHMEHVFGVKDDFSNLLKDDTQRLLGEFLPAVPLIVYATEEKVFVSQIVRSREKHTIKTLYSGEDGPVKRSLSIMKSSDGRRQFLAFVTENHIQVYILDLMLQLATIELPYASSVLLYENPRDNSIFVIGGAIDREMEHFIKHSIMHDSDSDSDGPPYGIDPNRPESTASVWIIYPDDQQDTGVNVQILRHLTTREAEEEYDEQPPPDWQGELLDWPVYALHIVDKYLFILTGDKDTLYQNLVGDEYGPQASGMVFVYDLQTWDYVRGECSPYVGRIVSSQNK